MKEFLLRATTLLAALICATVVGMYVYPMGLCIPGFIIWPLTLVVAAVFAALGASWVGTILAPDRTITRLLPVVIASEVAAILAAIFVLTGAIPAVMQAEGWVRAYHRMYLFGAAMVVIGLATSWAVWRFRESERRLIRDAFSTVGLAGLGALVFVGTLYVVYFLGLASC
jgi:hypothetical protein